MTIDAVLSGDSRFHVECCRAEDLCDRLPDGCVSLIAVDHPYHGVKDADWDNAWPSVDAFLDWTGEMLDRYRRIMAPNGSLYLFASTSQEPGRGVLATMVEQRVAERFAVLASIRWRKELDRGKHAASCKEALRTYFPNTEAVVFAEQRGSDLASGTGYDIECDRIRGEMFESLRSYLESERVRAGVTREECNAACGFSLTPGGMASRHYFSRSQWWLPTQEHYAKLKELFLKNGGDLPRSFDEVRAEYQAINAVWARRCADLDALRRPFTVSADVPYTDVWDYPTVGYYDGKHVCEKPWKMGLDIVSASSRPGDVILDCFSGSGCFPAAAVALGRRAIACDMDPHWAEQTRLRCERALVSPETARRNPKRCKDHPGQVTIFDVLKSA